jgi:hypothetical protein
MKNKHVNNILFSLFLIIFMLGLGLFALILAYSDNSSYDYYLIFSGVILVITSLIIIYLDFIKPIKIHSDRDNLIVKFMFFKYKFPKNKTKLYDTRISCMKAYRLKSPDKQIYLVKNIIKDKYKLELESFFW